MAKPKKLTRFQKIQVALQKAQDIFSQPVTVGTPKDKARLRQLARVVVWELDQGRLRVCEPQNSESESQEPRWVTHAWVKRAILAYFTTTASYAQSAGAFEYFDKLPPKRRSSLKGVRVLPGAVARYGSFIEEGAVLMPSFVNIGARVGHGTMVDTWATVGSCAQVGQGVHLSGGVGLGGVLEPAQADPVIIGDHAFIGSRAIIVEGVRVGSRAVIGAGVVLTATTKIIDVRGTAPQTLVGQVPAGVVVIPGVQTKEFAAGAYGVPCALIIGERRESTDLKTSLNQALREFGVSV